ncbi:heterokaryon incompatibility protein-domain-containing protein [Paraphoma chrysanthemicola]|uniref:Heterokaryon incompatibility protein-domain-containing protein n=1 Tax=Paraphoma chrysanthemicola TaxID=798071 RepID=A0A8K0QY82_9PLEO|nr:heterokaryon incompatibility protein-domain-containing protein [Paraphoma chrysanthemicola]
MKKIARLKERWTERRAGANAPESHAVCQADLDFHQQATAPSPAFTHYLVNTPSFPFGPTHTTRPWSHYQTANPRGTSSSQLQSAVETQRANISRTVPQRPNNCSYDPYARPPKFDSPSGPGYEFSSSSGKPFVDRPASPDLGHSLLAPRVQLSPPLLYSNSLGATGTPPSSLCRRCINFQIGTRLEEKGKARFGHVFRVTPSGIDPHCQLCRQFREILDTAIALGDIDTDSEFDLSREPLELLDERGRYQGQSLIIDFRRSPRKVSLFPIQGAFAKYDPKLVRTENVYPLGNIIKPSGPDFEMIRSLLGTCRQRHMLACEPSPPRRDMLRLINCNSRQILPAEEGQRYICLSYVWGQDAAEKLEIDSTLPDNVPQTVEDAMFVAKHLDIPYLWVDRYCIDQDKPDEKHNIIKNMDKIYQGAELTIIAAAGDSPHYGLPGVQGRPRKPQYRLQGDRNTYVAADSVKEEIKASRWNSRGWCYQEMLLSPRRLVFTDSQMYFQCTVQHDIESLCCGLTSTIFKGAYQAFPYRSISHDHDAADALSHRLMEYYQRQLSYQSDIIDAFLGVFSAFDVSEELQHSVTHFYGVPMYHDKSNPEVTRQSFLNSLLWFIEVQDAGDAIYSNTFPSWTWASVKADRPLNEPGELHINTAEMLRGDEFPKDINIEFWHRDAGPMDIHTFVNQDSNWKAFHPWLDVTTWTRRYVVELNDEKHLRGTGFFDTDRERIIIRDSLALERLVVHIICLQISGFRAETRDLLIRGLLVVEIEPGVYRRVDFIDMEFWFRDFDLTYEAQVEMECTLVLPPWEREQTLKRNGWKDPDILEKLPGGVWARRTVRLI